MYNRLIWFTILFMAIPVISFAQRCDCKHNFEHLYSNVMNNYAGSKDLITKKTAKRFRLLTDSIRRKSISADSVECYYLLKKWIRFFNDYHLGINLNYDNSLYEGFSNYFAKAQSMSLDSLGFEEYLKNKDLDFIEGKWMSVARKDIIGIVRDTKKKNLFIGFIIRYSGWFWSPMQIKFIIRKDGPYKYSVIKHYHDDMEETSPEMIVEEQSFYFKGSPVFFKMNARNTIPDISNYFSPSITQISNSTILLRLPSFAPIYKPVIDSIVAANRSSIGKTPNLIIDLRGNDGGVLTCANSILPYLYTKPIYTVGGEVLATPENIAVFSRIAEDTNIALSARNIYKSRVDTLQKNIGKLVKLVHERKISYDSVYEYPRNIGIVINGNVVSAGELFLLQARQSDKVKVFGTNTYGAVDYTEVYGQQSLSCKYYRYFYPMTRISVAKETPFHYKGIPPDIYIPRSTNDWIAYVQNYYESQVR